MEATIPSSDKVVSNEKPSQTVIKRIADLEETSPMELDPPLYSAIDPDALDAFFSSPATDETQTSRRIRFTYQGYEIHVRSEGDISIFEP